VDVPLLPGSRPRRLATISHQPPTLLTAVSRLSRNGSWSSLYILGTDGTVLTVTPLLRVTQPSPINGCFSGSRVLALSKYADLFGEIISVYRNNHTKHINALRRQNAEFVNVKAGSTYGNHCALKGSASVQTWLANKGHCIPSRRHVALVTWLRSDFSNLKP
jgi:hypothetical protein